MLQVLADFTLTELLRGLGYALMPYLLVFAHFGTGVALIVRGLIVAQKIKKKEPNQAPEPTLTVMPNSPMSSPLSTPSSFRVSVAHL
jgi:hypothetical protein